MNFPINIGMSPFKFFKKVTKDLDFTLGEVTGSHYYFIKNKVFSGKVGLNTSSGQISFDDVFFLVTQKIQIREKFCTILLTYKVEIVNDELMNILSEKFNDNIETILVFEIIREYSYKMENESQIYNYGVDNFKNILQTRFNEMIGEFKTKILNTPVYFKNNKEKNSLKVEAVLLLSAFNNESSEV